MSTKPRNRSSLSQLCLESRQALRRYVQKLVASPETAEEVIQEAFLRTFQHEKQVQTPRAFLFRTARNLATDVLRQRRLRRTQTLGDFDLSNVESQERSPEGQLLAEEESRLLREAIEHLPSQCRTVFTLKVFHACSYKEIADRLGIAPKTVENHIARAVREIHEYLRRRTR